eukprot:TRINITY_DN47496_c0_g1_i1.p1 TRINITY_DN47496_c0_g1~~TRINITY_DN47496_c0_g1_i1.p1  ORF type:complete len:468 (+),score=75.26 TRINITY_DN47496_c0_g1_i1:33-1406(+)
MASTAMAAECSTSADLRAGDICRVRLAVHALAAGYLEVRAGEDVEVLYAGVENDENERGWFYAWACQRSEKGWLPMQSLLASPSLCVAPDASSRPRWSTLGPAVAQRGALCPALGYLRVSAGARLVVQYIGSAETADEGWLFGYSFEKGSGGWFPADALEKPPLPPPPASPSPAESEVTCEVQRSDRCSVPETKWPDTGAALSAAVTAAEAASLAAARGLQLVGAVAPASAAWVYPLVDVQQHSFCGYLPSVQDQPGKGLDRKKAKSFIALVLRGVDDIGGWERPVGTMGPISRGTKWMVRDGCSCPYRYGGTVVSPTPFPAWMDELMAACMPLCGLHERERWPNSCNLNFYGDGADAVDWHADDEPLFDGRHNDCCIISLSLGEERRFELKPSKSCHDEAPTCQLQLGHGDLCTMEGHTQRNYVHRVPKKGNKGGRHRVNLTWRWIVAHDRRCCGL